MSINASISRCLGLRRAKLRTNCDPVRPGQETCPPIEGVEPIVEDNRWPLPLAHARDGADHLVCFVVAIALTQHGLREGRNITHSQRLQLFLTNGREIRLIHDPDHHDDALPFRLDMTSAGKRLVVGTRGQMHEPEKQTR